MPQSDTDQIITRRTPGELSSTSFDPATRRFKAVIATSTPVRRRDWMSGQMINEVLVIAPDAIDLSRVENGVAPLLDSHASWSTRDQIGAMRRAWIERGELWAEFELSGRDDIAPLAADLASGVVRGVSIGYRAEKTETVRGPEGVPNTVKLTRWALLEASLVAIPADPSASVRSLTGESRMPEPTSTTPQATTPEITDRAEQERQRATTINELAGTFNLRALGDEAVRSGTSVAAFRTIMLERLAAESDKGPANGNTRVDTDVGTDGEARLARAVEDGLYARMSGRPATGEAAPFATRSLVDVGAELLRSRRGAAWFSSPHQVASEMLKRSGGMHTVSDFPVLLGNAMQRRLLDLFTAAESGASQIAATGTARDFRPITEGRLTSFPELKPVNESGEITFGTLDETGEVIQIASFARGISITFQALVNDDLGAIERSIRDVGFAAAELKAKLIIAALSAKLKDGKALFHADHKNLAAAGASLGAEALGAGRLAMRRQTPPNSTTPLGIPPKVLMVPSELETSAEMIVALITPAQSADVNPFANKLTLAVEPRLTDPKAWYLFADPGVYPAVRFLTLEGFEAPRMEIKDEFDKLGTSYRVSWHVGAAAVDHRPAYKNPGQ